MTNLAGRGDRGREPGAAPRSWAASRRSIRPSSRTWSGKGVLDRLDAVAVHGFPLDWNHWQINEWPREAAGDPGRHRPAGLGLRGRRLDLRRRGGPGVRPAAHGRAADRASAADPLVQPLRPAARLAGHDPAPEAEGSSYYRHFYMGLLREDGTPKLAHAAISASTRRRSGICQWFHFEDHRLDDGVRWLKDLGVRHLRTGLSWADFYRPDARRVVRPPDGGARAVRRHGHLLLHAGAQGRRAAPHQPAQGPAEFADFCAQMVRRYAPG